MSTEKKPALFRYGLEVGAPDGLQLPYGTTAERSDNPKPGYFRLNSSTGKVEWYDGSWETAKKDLVFNATVTVDTAAALHRLYPVNTSGGQVTITLPSNPRIGDRVGIFDIAARWHVNRCVANANGKNIEGNPTAAFEIERDFCVLIWTGDATRGWIREAGQVPSLKLITDSVNLKADKSYVDTYHNRANLPSHNVVVGNSQPIFTADSAKRGIHATVLFVMTNGQTQMFDIMVVKDTSNNVSFSLLGEVRTNSDHVTFGVAYNNGIVITANTTAAGEFVTKATLMY